MSGNSESAPVQALTPGRVAPAPCDPRRLAVQFGGAWLLVFLLFAPGRFFTVDSFSAAQTTRQLLRGRLDIPENVITVQDHSRVFGHARGLGRDGLHYSRHELLWSALLVPFDLVALGLERALPAAFQRAVFPAGAQAVVLPLATQLVTALTVALLLRFLLALGVSARAAFVVASCAAGATMLLPYSRDLFRQPLEALLLLAAVAALWDLRDGRERQRALAAGVWVALAVVNRYATIVTLPVFAAAFAARVVALRTADRWLRTAPAFFLPIAIGLVAHFGSIWLRWGDPFANIGYERNFPSSLFESVPRYFLSPEGGLLGYCPLWLLLFWGFPALWRRGERWLTLTIAGLSVALIVVYGKYIHHWGGVNPGPRYLLPLIPLWFLALGALAEREKANRAFWPAWGAIAAAGAVFNLYESLVDYTHARGGGALFSHVGMPWVDDGLPPWSVEQLGKTWWSTLISMESTRWPAAIALTVLGAAAAVVMVRAWRLVFVVRPSGRTRDDAALREPQDTTYSSHYKRWPRSLR